MSEVSVSALNVLFLTARSRVLHVRHITMRGSSLKRSKLPQKEPHSIKLKINPMILAATWLPND